MPELPEVETLRRSLEETLCGTILQEAHFWRKDLRIPIPAEEFRKRLTGRRVRSFERRGKYVIMKVESEFCGIFHLGMSGQMLSLPEEKPIYPHTHAMFSFCPARSSPLRGHPIRIHYIDPRRFGLIDCIALDALADYAPLKHSGPEPLEHPDLAEHLAGRAKNKKTAIKPFLMDAKNLVGVGNIYACEALFLAGIHPKTPVTCLGRTDWERLAKYVQQVLLQAVKVGGTTIKDFRQMNGDVGYFSLALNVYGRTGEPCPVCSRSIEVERLSGRNSWFCAYCQKKN